MSVAARAHLGVGWNPEARAHFGWFYSEEQVVNPPRPAQPAIRVPAPIVVADSISGFGTGWLQSLRERGEDDALAENELVSLAEQIAELAHAPEIRTWTSAVLSQAGRRNEDLSSDTKIAATILRAAQRERGRLPLLDTARLGASFVSLGFNTVLAAHGEVSFSRAIVAVELDGAWRYADPHGDAPLGETRSFVIQRFYRVPKLVDAAEVQSLREELAKLQRDWVAHVTKLSAPRTTVVVAPPTQVDWSRWLLFGVAIGAAATMVVLGSKHLARPVRRRRRGRRRLRRARGK